MCVYILHKFIYMYVYMYNIYTYIYNIYYICMYICSAGSPAKTTFNLWLSLQFCKRSFIALTESVDKSHKF